MYHYKARIYSPTLGRFLQTDPVGYDDQVNLYAYVGNDPVNAVDPTGESCESKNGTTTCTVERTGSRIPRKFSFPTPEGWPSKIDSGPENHHSYDKKIGTKGSATRADAIRTAIVNDPTPGDDQPATDVGTENNASPKGASLTGIVGRFAPSPVKSYTRKDAAGNTMTVNVTLPGHPLFPGYVARVTESKNGSITVHNFGEGTGWLQSGNSPFASGINDVSTQQTEDIIDSIPQ